MRLTFRSERIQHLDQPREQTPPPRLGAIHAYGRMLTELVRGDFTPASADDAQIKAREHAHMIVTAPAAEQTKVLTALRQLRERELRTGRITTLPDRVDQLLDEARSLI